MTMGGIMKNRLIRIVCSGRRQDSDQVNKHFTEIRVNQDESQIETDLDSNLASTKRSSDSEFKERETGQLTEDDSDPSRDNNQCNQSSYF